MSARSRTVAGSRERRRSRAVPGVCCTIPPNNSLHDIIFTRSFCLSQEACTIALTPCFFLSVWYLLHVVSCPHFCFDFCSPCRPSKPRATAARQAFSRKTRILWLASQSVLSSNTRKFLGLSLVHDESTSARSWCRTRHFLCYCQETLISTCQQPPCI